MFAVVMVAVVLVAGDLQRAPADQLTTRAALGSIHLYQATFSRWAAWTGVQCRFSPTCSHYGEVCIREFGAARGSWLALKRMLRCTPWTAPGTLDPPPTRAQAGAKCEALGTRC